jgi:hypothetical protein
MNAKLSPKSSKMFEDVFTILNECGRLCRSPELFPSATSKAEFLTEFSILAQKVHNLRTIVTKSNDMLNPIYRNMDLSKIYYNTTYVNGKWYKLGSPDKRRFEPSNLIAHRDTRQPWNMWFDNKDSTFTEIYQQIPSPALHILCMAESTYARYFRNFERVSKQCFPEYQTNNNMAICRLGESSTESS